MYAILGCGSVGANVAKLLAEEGKVIVFDSDPKRVESLKEQGLDAFVEDITKFDPKKHGLSNEDIIMILTPGIETNLKVLKRIRKSLPKAHVVARALDLVSGKKIKEGKATYVIQSDVIARSVVKEVGRFEETKDANELLKIIKGSKSSGIGIFLHNNPDPDALASAMALRHICTQHKIDAKIFYGGEINRQENKAFVNLFDIDLTRIKETDELLSIINNFEKIVLIDAPKSNVNNVLPRDVVPNIILDHHPIEEKSNADFTDIRGIGATSTIMTRYLQQLEIHIDKKLAAALLYGIRSDTKSFTRNTTPEDLNAVAFLSPLADKESLTKVENPPMSPEAMEIMGKAIMNKEARGTYLISCVNTIKDRDALPQAAEFLLSLEGVSTVLIFGILGDKIVMSARTKDVRIHLGDLLGKAFGEKAVSAVSSKNGVEYPSAGGHGSSAGAEIPLGLLGDVDEKDTLINLAKSAVKKQFFSVIGVEKEEKPEEK